MRCWSCAPRSLPCGRHEVGWIPSCNRGPLSTVLSIPNSLEAPMKLVPRPDKNFLAWPLRAKKRHRAFTQLDVSRDSITSTCTWTHAAKHNGPALTLCLSTSSTSDYCPRPKDIKADVAEERTYFKPFRWKICHALLFLFSTKFAADNAVQS